MNISFAKKRSAFRAAVAAALVLLIVAMSAVCLSACNDDDGPDPAAERAEAVNALRVNTLAALDAKWAPGLTDAEIIALASPGSYIEAALWTEMLAEVVSASRLQTGKIRTAAEFIASDEGRKLFADAAGNLDSAMELVDALGLTSEDVSELGFDLLCAVVSETRAMYTEVANRLNVIKDKVLGAGNENIAAAAERAERIVASFGKDEASVAESVAQTLKALGEAEEGVKTVLAFAYDTERILGAGESGAGLSAIIGSAAEGEGALANVSEREMFAWLDGVLAGFEEFGKSMTAEKIASVKAALASGVLAGFEEFGKSMTAEKIASVKAALASVRECFQGFAQPVAAVGDVMEWLRVAESFADEIPTIVSYALSACNVIYERNAEDTYTYDFVRKLRLLAEEENEELRTVNTYALGAELFLSFAESHNAAELKGWIRDMAKEGTDLKSALIYAFALMAAQAESEGDVEVTPDLVSMVSVLLTEVFGSLMDETWRKYVLFPEKYENRLRIVSGLVISFAESVNELNAGGAQVDINVSSSGPYDSEWYAEVMRIREETIRNAGGTDGDALADKATAVIGEYIDASYARLDELRAAASVGYITDADSAEATKLAEEVQSNPIFMVFAFFFMQK